MTTSATNIAPVKWAQRKDSIYLTITLSDVKDHKVELTNNGLVFSGNSNGKQYSLNLEFFTEIEAEGSVWNVLASSVQMKLNKKDKDAEFWPRLLKDKNLEKTNVKIDWDRYIDEDEAEGKDFDMSGLDGGMDFGGMGGMGGMDFGGMGGFPGAGGFGGPGGDDSDDGENEEDSDDDEKLPDLESTEEQPSN